MSDELKPCPCGSERPHLAYAQKKPKQKYRIECECGWHGPVRDMIPEAIAAWNQRAKPVVKALEFVQNKIGSFDAVGWCYWIAQNDGGEAAFWAWGYAGDVLGEASHLPAAIAAVQREHTRRVHVCLEGYDD